MENFDNNKDTDRNKSIGKTLLILSTFTITSPTQKTSDIAKKLDMNISTVSRHLNTLLDHGFLDRDDESGYYYPGIQVVSMAGATLHNMPVYRYCLPELQKLSYQYDIHGHMSILHGNEIVHLISTSGMKFQRHFIPTGHKQPAYCTAMGRCFLANMDKAQLDKILTNTQLIKKTSFTKIIKDDLMDEIERIKRVGYCFLKDELNEGACSIGAPIYDQRKHVIAAISISTTSQKIHDQVMKNELINALLVVSNKISNNLGYFHD